ncbi:MAG: ABC transporter ATP-binding protein [Giesbergeria sp.]|uniref:ABC transporter ATP-binding protein n=1 Tax=Giesbergeria sp. TaxID=2818473 RepID=UPI00263898E4|nr:ABC transporter ATP-binding protein [Giesbergeria sp.]MDD2610074.1 ABC transporter ATP-binding protein [Giesbergeria sp.]
MLSDLAIEAHGVGKRFSLFNHPKDRLKQLLWGRYKQYSRDFWALQDVSFDIRRGEVVGLVGRNGAGKSTLLQMVCGTLIPTTGNLAVRGRVAALLELGAGFSPDFSGLENVYMNAAILGLSRPQVDERLDSILAFADIGPFIHQPVKTYSSGMFVRLAFAVATSVDPDILVIDEALSVGDGAFARKSFDRIMALKENGATILFCSHAMYHIQALCSRVLWLESGKMRMWDTAAKVTTAYETSLIAENAPKTATSPSSTLAASTAPATTTPAEESAAEESTVETITSPPPPQGTAHIKNIEACADGIIGRELVVQSDQTTLKVTVHFASDPELPCPSVAFGIIHASGTAVSSAGSFNDKLVLQRNANGEGKVTIVFPKISLLQGEYWVDVYLVCERALHIYTAAEKLIKLHVIQNGMEFGLITLSRQWEIQKGE